MTTATEITKLIKEKHEVEWKIRQLDKDIKSIETELNKTSK